MVSKKAVWISVGVVGLIVVITTTVLLVVLLKDDSDDDAKLEETFVVTNLGSINGSVFRTRLDKKFIGFRGIRYAEAPIGDLRFRVG
jgi:hypothetical protein